MKYGPKTEMVKAFIRHLKGMTEEQWASARASARDAAWASAWASAGASAGDAAWASAWASAGASAGDAAWDAAGDAAWASAGASAGDAAWDAAGDAAWASAGDAAWDAAWAANEIQGADLMRERGQPFYFLPMFGFASPEEIPQ
jgi:hypothetical protein